MPSAKFAFVAFAPASVFLFVLFAWLTGVFVGTFAACSMAGSHCNLLAAIVSGAMLAAVIANFAMITHPFWFMATSLAAVPSAGFAAARVAGRTAAAKLVTSHRANQ